MAFDLSTATPIASGGFDLKTAQPLSGGAKAPSRAWSDVSSEAFANLPSSAGKFASGMYEAVTNPVQTVKGLFQLAGGAAAAALPEQAQAWLIGVANDPEKLKQSIAIARAVGGDYAKRYGTVEGFKESLATDPVSVVSDFSTLLSGGAAATTKMPAVSKALATGATFTNPAAPIAKAAEYGLGMTAKVAGNVIDTVQGQRPAVRAGNIVRNALTEEGRTPQNLLAAQVALQNAPQGTTVRQALADVMSPQVQYLGEMVESRTAPGRAASVRQAQQADRMSNLQAVTPDLTTAEALRSNAATPLYTAATQPSIAVSTAPMVQRIDTILGANPGNAKLVSALNQVKTGLEASTNAQQVSSVLDNLKDLIASKDNKFIVKNLVSLKGDIEKALPGYEKAQQVFAATSGPVNQAKVLNAMQDVLQSPLGVGERAGPFMTAMGRGESALLKKSTGSPRFNELSDVLTPGQLKVVGEVESGLLRDANVANQTKAGAEAMKLIMDANNSNLRLPDFMSVKVTLANQMLRILEGRLNAKVMGELEKGFQSATSFTDLMKKVPASERLEVLRALGQAQGQLSANKLNVYTQMQNSMSSSQNENQNALAR
jgi:hypothetical protein